MRSVTLIGVVVLAMALLGYSLRVRSSSTARSFSEPQIKPVRENIVEAEHAQPPPILKEALADPDVVAVVRVTIDSAQGVERVFPGHAGGTQKELVTEYKCLVREIFKTDPRIGEGSTITVFGTSADVDRGDFIERNIDRSFPILKVNGDYVLFLQWYGRQSAWWVMFGPFGVWDLEGGVVRCLQVSELCTNLSGLKGGEFLEALRRGRE